MNQKNNVTADGLSKEFEKKLSLSSCEEKKCEEKKTLTSKFKSELNNPKAVKHYNSFTVDDPNQPNSRQSQKDEASILRSVPEVDVKEIQKTTYTLEKELGKGSFGTVYLAKNVNLNTYVAIKKVLQDKRYKNRELQIMKIVKHINIVSLKECFYSSGKNADEVYLNLILEYIPEPLSRFTHNFRKASQFVPLIYVKVCFTMFPFRWTPNFANEFMFWLASFPPFFFKFSNFFIVIHISTCQSLELYSPYRDLPPRHQAAERSY